jgi:carbamoyl-phosphate synthase large subunit
MKILFSNIGRRTYMVEFALALRQQGFDLELAVADSSDDAAGLYVSDEATRILTQRVLDDEAAYADSLLNACRAEGVDVVIPLTDFELPVLAARKSDFEAAGVRIIVSDPEIIEGCLDKKRNHTKCTDAGIPVPPTYFDAGAFGGPFPCIVKKIRGSASAGLAVVSGPDGFHAFNHGDDMIQEKVVGREYNIDILNDLEGNFVHCCAKEKLTMRAGETDKSRIINSAPLGELARSISATFRHAGNLDVDVMEDRAGNLFCIDFNPRFGGGYPTTHLAGLNYLKAILDMADGRQVSEFAPPKPLTLMKGISLHTFEVAP